MMMLAEMLVAVYTCINLIEEKRVDKICSKSAMQKNVNRLLFSKQKLFVCNLKKLLQLKNVY